MAYFDPICGRRWIIFRLVFAMLPARRAGCFWRRSMACHVLFSPVVQLYIGFVVLILFAIMCCGVAEK